MRDWIVFAALYVGFLMFFRLLGGFRSAGEALRRWGETRGTLRSTGSSS
jgi:hypothetical protein